MSLLALWLVGGFIGIAIGQRKGVNLAMAFLGGVILGPLAFLMIFVTNAGKSCPQCAEKVKRDALVCKHCSHSFEQTRRNDSPSVGYFVKNAGSTTGPVSIEDVRDMLRTGTISGDHFISRHRDFDFFAVHRFEEFEQEVVASRRLQSGQKLA